MLIAFARFCRNDFLRYFITAAGVFGSNTAAGGFAVVGNATNGVGVVGLSNVNPGAGVYGINQSSGYGGAFASMNGTALILVSGNMVVSTTSHDGDGSPISGSSVLVNVDNEGPGQSTATLPATGTDGQILMIVTTDPDGADIDGNVIGVANALTFICYDDVWRRTN